jgi:hypothetical protein
LYCPQFWDVHSCVVHGSRADFSRSGAVDSHFQENSWEELALDGCTFFFSEAHSTKRIFEFLEDHCREAGTSALMVQGGTEETGSEFGGFGKLEVEFSVVESIRG